MGPDKRIPQIGASVLEVQYGAESFGQKKPRKARAAALRIAFFIIRDDDAR